MGAKLSRLKKQALLDEVAEAIRRCRICKRDKIGVAVPGEGNPDANIVFLGEAPGKKEAQTGRPFIGPAGKLLRQLLDSIGLDAADVFITSPVKYLPEYVTPTLADIEHGSVHLNRQLDIIQPKVIVLMGNTAALAMLHSKYSIAKDHGKIIKQDGRTYFLGYHPAAPLYSPSLREVLRKDFQKLKRIINKHK
jgi:DNA polymerase